MLSIPDSVKSLFKETNVWKNFRVHFPNGEQPDICNDELVSESVILTESLCSQSEMTFGLSEANVLEFECVGRDNFKDATIQAQIEIDTWAYEKAYNGNSGEIIPLTAGAKFKIEVIPVVGKLDNFRVYHANGTNTIYSSMWVTKNHPYNRKGYEIILDESVTGIMVITDRPDGDPVHVIVRGIAGSEFKVICGESRFVYPVPYGTFKVESCELDDHIINKRRVEAYTELPWSNIKASSVEKAKENSLIKRNKSYSFNLRNYILATFPDFKMGQSLVAITDYSDVDEIKTIYSEDGTYEAELTFTYRDYGPRDSSYYTHVINNGYDLFNGMCARLSKKSYISSANTLTNRLVNSYGMKYSDLTELNNPSKLSVGGTNCIHFHIDGIRNDIELNDGDNYFDCYIGELYGNVNPLAIISLLRKVTCKVYKGASTVYSNTINVSASAYDVKFSEHDAIDEVCFEIPRQKIVRKRKTYYVAVNDIDKESLLKFYIALKGGFGNCTRFGVKTLTRLLRDNALYPSEYLYPSSYLYPESGNEEYMNKYSYNKLSYSDGEYSGYDSIVFKYRAKDEDEDDTIVQEFVGDKYIVKTSVSINDDKNQAYMWKTSKTYKTGDTITFHFLPNENTFDPNIYYEFTLEVQMCYAYAESVNQAKSIVSLNTEESPMYQEVTIATGNPGSAIINLESDANCFGFFVNVRSGDSSFTQKIEMYASSEGKIYDLSNEFSGLSDSVLQPELMWKALQQMAENINGITYKPMDVECIGLPYLEAGDILSVTSDQGNFRSPILRRTLKGIQMLKDNFESRG